MPEPHLSQGEPRCSGPSCAYEEILCSAFLIGYYWPVELSMVFNC